MLFQRLRNGGQPRRNRPRHLRRLARRVQRKRIAPDRCEKFAGFLPPQVVEVDPEGPPVRELVIGFPVAAEVGVKLETMADVADDGFREAAERSPPPGAAR